MATTTIEKIAEQAAAFLGEAYFELGKSEEEAKLRIEEVMLQIEQTGSYTHTYDELKHGAKMAWRNNNRCIGRLFWNTLEVFDARDIQDEHDAASRIFQHMSFATNNGRIRPAITVFPANHAPNRIRIWNHQLVRYAGYDKAEGIVGDSSSIAFTAACEKLGWTSEGTRFDVLPLVIQRDGEAPQWFSLPQETVLTVPLSHPENEDFEKLKLQWYAVPFIADMELEIGGIIYHAAPFNGWYMGTEIGARNLSDTDRYNQLPTVAKLFQFDTTTNTSLWKDRALIELNIAVLHSYRKHGVSIVDHHTAAEQFLRFEKQEQGHGRTVTGRWSWLIPPMSPATTGIWHRSLDDTERSPAYRYQPAPY
ncbi:nitric oxide synthase [Paenibacillus sp. FSL H8-0548]|uniref:nitric oxide synthase oxygenase n=1 Tax=Paenibacillus sp. FSL H8-0548 TaxID=1920422 RepID=UPI00096F3BC5|nr:nitric oxide synthase oxygenase [Paenibacillus sp. FSL H8-0548]OMF24828.1 nitric oxide synthase [Paenibacillus sp. FSL H8-0548]